MNCGCKLIATVHGSSIDDLKQKPVLRRLVEERIFERYIVLNNKGKIGNIDQIYDSREPSSIRRRFTVWERDGTARSAWHMVNTESDCWEPFLSWFPARYGILSWRGSGGERLKPWNT